jgi:hypothetical protein
LIINFINNSNNIHNGNISHKYDEDAKQFHCFNNKNDKFEKVEIFNPTYELNELEVNVTLNAKRFSDFFKKGLVEFELLGERIGNKIIISDENESTTFMILSDLLKKTQ